MIRKLSNDNGLQDWKTEHQAVTGGIFYCRDSAGFSVSASNKLSCNLRGQYFEIGNKNIPPNRCMQAEESSVSPSRPTKNKKPCRNFNDIVNGFWIIGYI